ncbi:MAG: DUF4440 domain-containing protein [Pyrinomonadaceae bacterium]|nr:DUF4440 domain-containing protein [Pyrinomonadaceae bacterium]
MKNALILFAIVIFGSASAFAQPKETNPADVASPEAIIKAVYEVISGDAGKARDWDRFRTLFHKDARLIPTGKNPNTGVVGASFLSPEDYIQRAGPTLVKDGFHERELAHRIDRYGNIAQVFSTYLSFRKADDKTPFMRGINSFQLMNDGKRWWIVNIFWQAETPDNPIPKQYEKTKKN